jgi:hypothetical protein
MSLIRLIYCSTPVGASFDVLDTVLRTSRVNNARANVTGALLSSADYYLQLLEGDRAAVSDCFMRIVLDKRHEAIRLITTREVKIRLFPDWTMHHIAPDPMRDALLRRYAVAGRFDPTALSERAICDLCKVLAGSSWRLQKVA